MIDSRSGWFRASATAASIAASRGMTMRALAAGSVTWSSIWRAMAWGSSKLGSSSVKMNDSTRPKAAVTMPSRLSRALPPADPVTRMMRGFRSPKRRSTSSSSVDVLMWLWAKSTYPMIPSAETSRSMCPGTWMPDGADMAGSLGATPAAAAIDMAAAASRALASPGMVRDIAGSVTPLTTGM